jgi:hypothetical protein
MFLRLSQALPVQPASVATQAQLDQANEQVWPAFSVFFFLLFFQRIAWDGAVSADSRFCFCIQNGAIIGGGMIFDLEPVVGGRLEE